MVRHYERLVVNMYAAMEVMEDEKSPEIKARAPERIRHPGIKVIISLRRRVIGNDRRTLIIIVIVNHSGVRIGRRIVYLFIRNAPFRRQWGNILGGLRLGYLWPLTGSPDYFQVSMIFTGNRLIAIRIVYHPILIDIFIDDVICRSSGSPLLHVC